MAESKPASEALENHGYVGVTYSSGRYSARYYVGVDSVDVGSWSTAQQAAIARDRAILHAGLDRQLNLPAKSKRLGPASPSELLEQAQRLRRLQSTVTRYFGVEHGSAGQWAMRVRAPDGKRVGIHFATELAAAQAYDRAVRGFELDLPLNFPEQLLPAASIAELRAEANSARKPRPERDLRNVRRASQYIGVTASQGRYIAYLRHEKRALHLGCFDTEEQAARAYDEAAWDTWADPKRLNFEAPKRPSSGKPPERKGKPPKQSRYLGVSKMNDKYQASVRVAGEYVHLGAWRRERDAALARDRVVLYLGIETPLNLPGASRTLGPLSPEDAVRTARFAEKKLRASGYLGVSQSTKGMWFSGVKHGGRFLRVNARSEHEAAVARDRLWLHCGNDPNLLNFPHLPLEPADVATLRKEARDAFKQTTTSQYRGVCLERRTGTWLATVNYDHETIHLGTFDGEQEAAQAYDKAAKALWGKDALLNFPD